MKIFSILILFGILMSSSCQEEDKIPETAYSIYQSGFTPTNGDVTVSDLGGGKLQVKIQLRPFVPGQYEAHLHFGDIREVGELAYRLNDVDGETGFSKTILDRVELSNGEVLTYERFLQMDGSIKVHMSGELFKNTVLAYGNVGKNDNYLSAGITACTGHN
jgi:hypothetical protein